MIFIDCEFTQLKNPVLLSIGLVADSGEEAYIEISDMLVAVRKRVKMAVKRGFQLSGWKIVYKHDGGSSLLNY